MKITKITIIMCLFCLLSCSTLFAQTQSVPQPEIPNWCKNKAIEFVNKLKADVTISVADSAALVEEYALRLTKGNNAWKAATTPEDKKAAQENAYKEYNERLKNRLQKDVYNKILKWQIQQNKK